MKKARIVTEFEVTEGNDFGLFAVDCDGYARDCTEPKFIKIGDECLIIDLPEERSGLVFAYFQYLGHGFWINESYVSYDV